METKKEIRKRIRALRAAIPSEEKQRYSNRIIDRLLIHPLFLSAKEIYCYVSAAEEVSTIQLIEKCWKMGKTVAVPKVIVDNVMEFYYINNFDELEAGYCGILEPVLPSVSNKNTMAGGKDVLVVMPGVAFDRKCGRIGYGKGFYDAYLNRHPDYRRIALAFSAQLVDNILTDEQDVRPEIVMTEKGSYTC